MKRMKNTLAALVAALMLVSCFSVGATSFKTLELLEDYTLEESYSQTFTDTEASHGSFVDGKVGTVIVEDEMLKLTDSGTDKGTEMIYKVSGISETVTKSDSLLSCVEFETKADASIGTIEYRVGSASNYNNKLQLRLSIDFSTKEISARMAGVSGRPTIGLLADDATQAKVKVIFDYANDKTYLWINDTLYMDGSAFAEIGTSDYSAAFTILAGDNAGAYGSVYLDNLKISKLVINKHTPQVATLLYGQNFEEFDLGSESSVNVENFTKLANSNGVIDTDDLTAYNGKNELYITKDTSRNSQVLHITATSEDNQPNYIYFTRGVENIENYNGAGSFVLEYSIKSSNASYYAVIRGTSESNGRAPMKVFNGNVDVYNGDNTAVPIYKNLRDGNWHKVTWLFKMDGEDSKDKYSLWIDDEKVATDYLTRSNFTNVSDLNYICFRAQAKAAFDAYIDDFKLYKVSDDFAKMDSIRSKITGLADICAVDGDAPTDLLSADTILANKGFEAGSYSVTFKDTKGYVQNNSLVFPLYEDTTDLAVEISSGAEKETTVFSDVTIPAAYTFTKVNPADSASNIAEFNAGTIEASVRNTASDIAGRLKVLAAIYDKNTGKMIKVQPQADTLGSDGVFDCKLDLSAFSAEDLANTQIKLFIWESGKMVPMI